MAAGTGITLALAYITASLFPTFFPFLTTELMKEYPEPMMAALVLHNSLVEKSKWANFGSVIEQEGGSFCLIFNEAGDAVKFCLQVSQGTDR